MPVSIEELRPHLQAFDFPRLFVEGLGWDHYVTEPFVVRVNERDYTIKPIAEKAGFAVYECDSSIDNNVPQYPVRRKIESEVAKRTFEHLIIFTDPGRRAQVWQWVRRESGKPAACREYGFTAGGSGDHLLQRIQPLFVSLEEEPSLNIALVASRVRAALDVERITKRFYERFQTELTAFGDFIAGITAQGNRDLVRLPHAQPHDVRLLRPEAGLPRRRPRLPAQPPSHGAATERRWTIPAVLSALLAAPVPRGIGTAGGGAGT